MQQQRVVVLAGAGEVPLRLRGETGRLLVHAALAVVRDEHGVGCGPPGGHLGGVDTEPRGHLGAVLRRVGRAAQVAPGHQVGEDVVVDQRGILVRAGDAGQVERAAVVEVAVSVPQPGGLDQHLGAALGEERGVTGGRHVPQHRVGDVGVDVQARAARRPVAGALPAAECPPRVGGAGQAQFGRPLAGLGQVGVPPAQRRAGQLRRQVRQHRQHVALGVPEHVPVVAVAGQSLGRDGPVAVGAAGLDQVEHREPHRELQFRVAVQLDVGGGPRGVQGGALLGEQGVEPVVPGRVRLRDDQVGQLTGRGAVDVGALVRGEPGDPDPVAGAYRTGQRQPEPVGGQFGVGGDLVGCLDPVRDGDGDPLAAAPGAVHEHTVEAVVAADLAGERVVDHRGGPGVVGAFRHPLVGEQVGADPQPDRLVQRLHRPVDGGDRTAGQRDQAGAADADAPAAGRDPFGLPADHPGTQVQFLVVSPDRAGPQVQRLVVDPEPDQGGVRRADHGVAAFRERVPALRVGQVVLLVEPVEVAARHPAGLALVERPAPAHPAVGEREDGLGLAQPVQVRARAPDPPTVVAVRHVPSRVRSLDRHRTRPGWEVAGTPIPVATPTRTCGWRITR